MNTENPDPLAALFAMKKERQNKPTAIADYFNERRAEREARYSEVTA